jgi:hypothetical protein
MNRTTLAVVALAALSGTALAGPGRMPLAAHRAAYDLSLKDSDGKGIESARGRIVFEFTGTACEGYAVNFRQVTEVTGGEIGRRLSDMRSNTFEESDGKSMRFATDSRMEPGAPKLTDGTAEMHDGKLSVQLKKPAPGRFEASGEIVFPAAQIHMLIEAAKAGRNTLSVKVFDGSEGGRKIYDTFSVIGKPITSAEGLEPALTGAGWQGMTRWPVTVSYYEEGQADSQRPVYTLGFELLENGVSRKLKLDYGDFSLNGDLTRLDVMQAPACDKD